MERVSVVIPAYKSLLSETDRVSLMAAAKNLGSHPISLVVPQGLDVSQIKEILPTAKVEEFAPEYFKGIQGYNTLMMSEEFYSRFSGYEYILIYQTDAYVFDDKLIEWCDKGYDYIGAPWLVRTVYKLPVVNQLRAVKHIWRKFRGKPDLTLLRWRVGNGGLSLRKVQSHLKAVKQLKPLIDEYLKHRNHAYNEDVFFSVVVNSHGQDFKYPDWPEALQFSFDKYPAYCYRLNDYRLPFGCHAWTKRRMRKFWNPIIMSSK